MHVLSQAVHSMSVSKHVLDFGLEFLSLVHLVWTNQSQFLERGVGRFPIIAAFVFTIILTLILSGICGLALR